MGELSLIGRQRICCGDNSVPLNKTFSQSDVFVAKTIARGQTQMCSGILTARVLGQDIDCFRV